MKINWYRKAERANKMSKDELRDHEERYDSQGLGPREMLSDFKKNWGESWVKEFAKEHGFERDLQELIEDNWEA